MSNELSIAELTKMSAEEFYGYQPTAEELALIHEEEEFEMGRSAGCNTEMH
jgi:hypothetical protein